MLLKNQSCKQLLRHILWWSTQWWWISKKNVGYNFNRYGHYSNCSYGNAWCWILEDIKPIPDCHHSPGTSIVDLKITQVHSHLSFTFWVERGVSTRLGETVTFNGWISTGESFVTGRRPTTGGNGRCPQFKLWKQEIHDVRSIAKRKGSSSLPEHSLFSKQAPGDNKCFLFSCMYVCVSVFVCVLSFVGVGAMWCCVLLFRECIVGCFHKLCPLSGAATGIKKARVVWFPV